MTILSVNKTRESEMGALRSFFIAMNKKTKKLTQSALIAALYVVLTYLEYAVAPTLTNGMIQFRLSEALCVLAFFTPSAIWGLSVGCLLFNLINGATALDFVVGTAASALAAIAMYHTRSIKIGGYPLPGMLMPAIFNGVLVGWELSWFLGFGFWLNAMYVAVGEVVVLMTLGTALYYTLRHKDLYKKMF